MCVLGGRCIAQRAAAHATPAGRRADQALALPALRFAHPLARLQESGLKVKEFELLRKNFSATGNFGEPLSALRTSAPLRACSPPTARR